MSKDRLRTIATRFAQDVRDNDVGGLSAELAYRYLFALFPFGLFVTALGVFVAGWLGIANPAEQIVSALDDNLPPDLAASIQPELEHVIGSTRPELVSLGALGALWAATGGTNALIKAMNRAYNVEETRPFRHRLVLAVGLTLLAGAGIIVSFVTIVGGALITEQIAEQFGLTGAAWTLVTILRWPAVFALLVVAVAVLYRLAPNVRVSWRWNLAGAAIFALGWLAVTFALAWWIGNVAGYGATYGSLGSVIVLMLWFYVTGLLLVGSATLIAVIAHVLEPEQLQRRREELSVARELRVASGHAQELAGQAMEKVRQAMPIEDDGGPDRPRERRLGPSDRRRALQGSPRQT